jgi:succinoglycan biosynthesis protein ExoV
MKVIYFQDPQGNFGDELNRWLWPKVFEDAISDFSHHGNETKEQNNTEELLFYGIGTIFNDYIPQKPEKIVFGSGFGYGKKPKNLDGFNIFFVRGKKTAKELGISPDKGLTDPAILLRNFFPVIPDSGKCHDVSFMPHHSSPHLDSWRKACDALEINYISPLGFDVETTIREISSSRLVIAEAMHAAIVADTFRVPWIPVSSSAGICDFKWQDWCGSLGLSYTPVLFTRIYPHASYRPWKKWLNTVKEITRKHQLDSVAKSRNRAMLSDSTLLDNHLVTMNRHVQELRDYLQESGRA